jgi:hypothetical protein
VKLGEAWDALDDDLGDARIRVVLEEPGRMARGGQLLAPLQPFRAAPNVLSFRVVGHSDAVRRLLERLDAERIYGTLELISSDPAALDKTEAPAPTLRESWESELATLPADWSDLLAEVEFDSSDWLDRAAVSMVPLNPRRDGARLAFRFRAARTFGYGASTEMVSRCLSRCDEAGIRGRIRILRALSGTQPVQTQGPVWQLEGQTV